MTTVCSDLVPPPVPTTSDWHLRIRWLGLVGFLFVEFVIILDHFEAPKLGEGAEGAAWLFAHSKGIWLGILGFFLIFLLSFIPRLPRLRWLLGELQEQAMAYHGWPWLIAHALTMLAFGLVTAHVFAKPIDPDRLSMSWFVIWFVLGGMGGLLWLLAVAPGRFWWQLVRMEHRVLLGGALLTAPAGWLLLEVIAQLTQNELWKILAGPTMWLVHQMLGGIYPDLIHSPEQLLIGTPTFLVGINSPCSGYEGIVLIIGFLSIYLALFRQDHRFPQAFWLFPLGMVAIWLINAVRIALLVVVGTSLSPEIAAEGFHSQAGWIAFISISLGLVALSRQIPFFRVAGHSSSAIRSAPSIASALLMPLIVLMGSLMLTLAFSDGFHGLYPLCVIATATVLWYHRAAYRGLGWAWSWQAPALGVAVFLVWIFLVPSGDFGQPKDASSWSTEAMAVWWVFRVVGFVLIVPLAEEFAFRGYLLRKLVATDFEKVRSKQFHWFAFLTSSFLFGLLHQQWLAGTLAGMAYALAVYWRGRLGDAVLAHATTNALLAVLMLYSG